MPTAPDETRQTLTTGQLNAIDRLVTGATDSEAADVAGVTRQTVNGWRRHNPMFKAELNRRREAIMGASVDRLRALLPVALDTLERELKGGENGWKAALKILEIGGTGSPSKIGPTDSHEFLRDRAEARRLERDPLAGLDFAPPNPEELEAARGELELTEILEAMEAGDGED